MIFEVLDASVRLELERGDDRSGMDLDHRSFDRELAALFFQETRAVHQFALVDLALGLRRIEQRERRQRIVALPAFGRRLGDRFRIRQWEGRRRHGHFRRASRRLGTNAAEHRRRGRHIVRLGRLPSPAARPSSARELAAP